MTNPENPNEPNPIAAFADSVARRQQELAHLQGEFAHGLEVVTDMESVNERLTASVRPDLAMTARADMIPALSPANLGDINNFYYKMRGFGIRETNTTAVYRPYDEFEKQQVFQIAGRGSLVATLTEVDRYAIDRHTFEEAIQTHAPKEAFLRMWIVLPELTEQLMSSCLNDEEYPIKPKTIDEELFVAYTLMAQLVDVNDMHAHKSDDSIDSHYLTR